MIDSDARKILPGAIRWERDTLPVFGSFDDFGNELGTITNTRREEDWIVGDLSFDLGDPEMWFVTYYLIGMDVKLDRELGCFTTLDGILCYVVIVPNPANPERTDR